MPELFIEGKWTQSSGGGRREILCPADGRLVATVAEAGPADTEAAIAAARAAFDEGPWPRTPERERGALLLRVADLLERDTRRVRPRRVAGHRQAAGREPSTTSTTSSPASATTAASAGTDAGRVVDTGSAGRDQPDRATSRSASAR